jgi:SulP family sulfate permease
MSVTTQTTQAAQSTQNPVAANIQYILHYFSRPVKLAHGYNRDNLRPDLIAGVTVAVIALPQAIAFALVAELPPEAGLYAAIVAAIVGALWGSSDQMSTGPANAVSLLVLSTLTGVAVPGTADYMMAAGLLALMVGVFQLTVGLTGLGLLINFVSHSVVVGFAAGAGVLIALGQVRYLLGVEFSSRNLLETVVGVAGNLTNINPPTFILGVATIILIVLLRKYAPGIPYALVSIVVGALAVFTFQLGEQGVEVLGEIPRGFPPIARLPIFDFALIGQMSTGALAVGAIGLIQTAAIARSISTQTGQRLDSNQEFVGQGLANISAGIFSGYAGAGSFSRSAVNLRSGAKSAGSNVFAGIFILIAMLIFAPLAAYVPRASLAAVLIITAFGMIDKGEIVRILRGTRGDALIMAVTLIGTLFLNIEFAVLLGILLSFALYIMKSSVPKVQMVVPDKGFKHFVSERLPDDACPQMGIVQISGDLYFGAVSHVEETVHQHLIDAPEQRFLLFRMHSVNQCDFSGIHMLESIRQTCLDRSGDIFFVRLQEPVAQFMKSTGFYDKLGDDHFLDEDQAITYLFHKTLDPAICIYECPVRVFKECQNLPKQTGTGGVTIPASVSAIEVEGISPNELWQSLSVKTGPPLVVDVREPREYKRGHIPAARLMPLPRVFADIDSFPRDRDIVFVCRGGRRSTKAAQYLSHNQFDRVKVLQGGMLAWESAKLLEAIDK